MSGICGILRLDGTKVQKKDFRHFFDAMQHRGSDREGVWINNTVALGHKALWSTPESLHEQQPLVSHDGRYVLTADARIDNREELFNQFGLIQKSDEVVTDAALILLAWEKWGKSCTEHLIGDFAFAVYDQQEDFLFFTRDHIGIRPFYYVLTDSLFCFASEIMPLFKVEGVEKVIDEAMEEKYFRCRNLDYEETFFTGVKRLPPASCGVLKEGQLSLQRYWFPEKIEIDKEIAFEEAVKKFRAILTEAVRCRMRTRSPIGCELSGGLDSTSVFSLAVTLRQDAPLIPISKHFGKMKCDESSYSELAAREKGYTLETIRMDRLDFKEKYSLDRYYSQFQDWPQGVFFMGIFPVAERMKSLDVHVLLTGQGGDHVCRGSGYVMADYFRSFRWFKLAQELSKWEWSGRAFKSHVLRPNIPDGLIKFIRKLKKSDHVLPCGHAPLLLREQQSFAFAEELEMMTGQRSAFLLDAMTYHDAESLGIESRHPFFDKRLVEFSLSLPSEYKLANGYTKRILRASLADILPKKIGRRKDKAEFGEMLNLQMKHAGIPFQKAKKRYNASIDLYFNMSYTIWRSHH